MSWELSAIVSTLVQGKTRCLRLSDRGVLLLNVIMNIAVIIYSWHLSRWRHRGLTLLFEGNVLIPICLNASMYHSWPSFIYKRSEYKRFYEFLQIAFPHSVLVNKVLRLKFTVCSSLDWREGRDEQSSLAFKATWTKNYLLKTVDLNRVKHVFFVISDTNLYFENHIFHVTKTAFFYIRHIAKLWNMLTISDAEKLVHP